MEFRAASRGVVASRCAACQAAWRKAFDRLRPSRNKAERAEYFAQKKAAGLIENGKVKRGRPAKSNRDRMNSVTRSQVDAIREQLDRMAASDLFYARSE
jgi:hypothetical protein